MPVKHLENQAEFNYFKAELRNKFQENFVSFHVCKDIHGNEECDQCNPIGPEGVVSQAWNQPTFLCFTYIQIYTRKCLHILQN